MSRLIDVDAFIREIRKIYCEDCARRKGIKNGKMRFCYEIGGVPCRACDIEDVLDALDDYTPTIQPEPHWIPVTENTLPEENRVVVMCGDKGTWDFGTYRGHGDDIHFWHWKKNTYKRVYWWMYKEDALPEPFKGGRYEQEENKEETEKAEQG